MKHIEDLKEVLGRELDKFAKQGDVSVNTLEKIHKLSDTYKNLCKIEMLESEEGEGSYGEGSYGEGSSYRRGRGRNARRDSMGRYSREEGYSRDEGYSQEGYSERRGSSRASYDSGKDRMMNMLGGMMEDADPKEREALKECMRAIERG